MKTVLAQVSPPPGSISVGSSGSTYILKSPLRSDITDISSLINVLMSILFPVATILLFIMFVYAGFTFMNSGGNPQSVAKARQTMTAAIIGICLLVISFFLARLVAFIFGFEGGILG